MTLTIEKSSLAPSALAAGNFWAILDPTDAPVVWERVADPEIKAVSLYQGMPEEQNWDVSPWLLPLDEETFDWIKRELWPDPWGIALKADSDLESLREHFQQFVKAKDYEGQSYYFRFYDPRVLTAFLPICRERELNEFFGPVEEYWALTPDGEDFAVHRLAPGEGAVAAPNAAAPEPAP